MENICYIAGYKSLHYIHRHRELYEYLSFISMESCLDPQDWGELRKLGNEVLNDMLSYLEHIRDDKVWIPMTPDVRATFFQASPTDGIHASNICDEVRQNVLKYGSGNVHPGFMGWVQGGITVIHISHH